MALPRYYANACIDKPENYYDYQGFELTWGPMDYYEVVQKIGRGKYSEVFDGVNTLNNQKWVIKILKPIKEEKMQREIKILQTLYGGKNIIKLYDMAKDEVSEVTALIFERVNHTDHRILYKKFTDFDIRYYIYEILLGLDYCHSLGIMHRDIKPHNIMIDHEQRQLRIIDWGLAEYYIPDKEYNVRVASRYYKGPELLVDDQLYNYSLDIWSLGCTMANMMFQRDPMFKGSDNDDQLIKIAEIMGIDALQDYLRTYNLQVNRYQAKRLKNWERVPWKDFFTKSNQHLISEEALDFLDKWLVYDREKRIAPWEAFDHPYFAPVLEYKKKISEDSDGESTRPF